MNLKSKILEYFKEHWEGHIFLKSVCMVVSACLIINILNLPAFASTEEDLRKKALSLENKHQDVLYQRDTSFNTVSVMNSLESSIKIDKKAENIFVGKELKGFLSKEKDEQGRRKVMVRKGESFEEDPVLTAMVDNKLKGRKYSRDVKSRQISQDQRTQEQSPGVKEGESARQQKDKTTQEQESKEVVKEESVPKQQEAKEGVQQEVIEQEQEETSRQQEKPKQQSQPEQKDKTETATEDSSNRQEQTSDAQRATDVENSSDTSKKSVKELAESLQIDEKDRAKVIDEIAKQTGLSKEEVEAELSKLDQAQREGVIAALANLFGQGKDIVYCVADVLGTVLSGTSKGLLAFEAILADAIAGIFVKNNQELIRGKSDQLMLSAQAIQTVLEKHGKDYVGIDTNIEDIIAGLDVGESAIVHVGGNHFITITKNEDGTFTKSDINKPAERLTEEELKVAIEREYGLKEEETTTVLVKNDNDKFKGIKRVDNLREVLGAERTWNNSDFGGKSQEQYYRDYGEESYEMLMKNMYGTTNLTPEQSRDFAAFYEEFLKAAILDIDKTMSDEKASEESKELAKALKSQAAKELAIIGATLEVLREHPDGVVSGQIGQVLLTGQRAYPSKNQDIADGEYYQVITIYADDLKEQHSITGPDGKTVSIESYRISKGSSISTREGVTVTRSDGSTYQVFGIGGKFEGMDVAFEYIVAYNADGTFYVDEKANIYLLNDTDRVYQVRKESGSRPPTSGQYKGAAPERENWTHGKIIETETGYIIFGAGSRISAKKTSRGWEADAIGIGTEAMRGSVLRIAANDPNGVAATIFLDVKDGFMVYAGGYWVPSDGFVWKFNESVSDEQIKQFLKNTITTQLGSNADGIEEIELIGSNGVSIFGDLTFKQWLATLSKDLQKYYSSGDSDAIKAGQEAYKEYQDRFKEYRNKTMLGAPFSTAAIFKSMGISAKIHTKGGFTYDATKSDGDIYKLTIDSPTVLELKVQDDELVMVATEDISVRATISEGDWALETGGTTLTDTIKKGQVFSFATMLNNTGRQIVNTREIEIITGYEITGQDDKGNNYYDYSKPKYSKMKAGSFKVGGNSNGKYVIVNNLYISISNGNWDTMNDQSGSQYDNTGENCAYWHAGAEITISKKGSTFDISITKGDLTVKNLTVTLYHKMNDSGGGGDDSDDKYEGPTIEGAYITDRKDLGNDMYSYKINSGTFKGVSGDQVTQNSLGNFLFVPGSDFKKGSIIQADATRAKYDSKIKKDGSIDAYGAKWYEKMWDGIVGFFSILAFSLMTILTLGAMKWAKNMKGMEWAKEWAAITYGYWNHVEANGSNEEAVQKGMDLGIAGLAAVAILVVTAISLAVSIFTGGASIAAGIAAVVTIAGAVASSVSAINLTNSAIQAFRAGKGGQGALMLFFALLTVVLACVGAGQMGNTIASGLVSLGKQFFIKMAIGAAIGAVAGAGIAAASCGIRYAIDKSKGRADDFDWEEFGKEVGIGALTGAFAGAAAGAQVATAVAKSVARGVAQQIAKGVSEGVASEVGQEVAKDVSKEIAKQVSKDVSKEMAKIVSKDVAKQTGEKVAESIAKNVSTQITQSLTKAVSVGVGQEVVESVAEEVGKKVGQEVTENVAKEVGKNIVEDLASNVAKSVQMQVVEQLSNEVPKEVAEKIAKNVAEKVAKSISRSISESVAKNVSVSVGQIAKEMILGGTSFTKVAGQTPLQYIGTITKSIATIVGRVGMQALNGYISYMSAKSFVDSIENGDFMGAVKAMYTLVSINIIMPVMSAHSAIKEGGTLKGADLGKEVSAELTSSAKEAEKVAGQGMTIHGMSVGWKVGSVAITTVVGAGAGVGVAAAIDAVSGKKINAKDLIIGGTVGGVIGFGFGALATKEDWTALGNSVKTTFAKTVAPFGGKTAQLTRAADGTVIVKAWNNFSGAAMLRAWGGLVGGGAIGVGIGAGIWAAKGAKKEDMARYLIVGGVAGGLLGAGFANAWSQGAYKEYRGLWDNFKANPGAVFMQAKQYIQESLERALMMAQDINITYMAYITGILNQIYYKITGGSLANTDIVKSINKVTGMSLFKSEEDKEKDQERERKRKKAQEKGEEFVEEEIEYKASFDQREVNAIINKNWESLTGPTMYAGNFVGGMLKPVVGAALQHSPILGSVMNVVESAGSLSIMQQNKAINMFYMMGVKIRLLNLISKQVFDDPKSEEDDQVGEFMSFAFMQMFESIPPQEQAGAMKFLESSKEITYTDKNGKEVRVELGVEVYNSAVLLKNSPADKFAQNLETVCSNLRLDKEVVGEYVKPGMEFNQIVCSLVREYVIKGLSLSVESESQLLRIRSDLNTIIETSPIMKQKAGLFTFDIINSISSKLNYLEASGKILELNIEGISVDSIASGTLSKQEYTKILQAQDGKETGSGVGLVMNYLSGISSVRTLPINDLISAVVEYRESLYEQLPKGPLGAQLEAYVKEVVKPDLESLKLLKLSEVQINRINEIVSKEGAIDADNKLTQEARSEISKALGESGSSVVVNLIVGNLDLAKIKRAQAAFRNIYENSYYGSAQIIMSSYMRGMLGTSVVARHDPLTKELIRSLEKQSFRAESYLTYTTLRNSAAIKDVIEIERLRNINESIRSDEQKGQLAMLEEKYLPIEIEFNREIKNRLDDVASGKLSYEEFGLIVEASEGVYGSLTSAQIRKKVGESRTKLSSLVVDMTKEVIKNTEQLEKEGQISKAEGKEILDSIRANAVQFSAGEKKGNTASLMYASASARSMLSFIRTSNILPVVTADGTFLTYNTGAGKDVVEVNSVKNTEKGMKVNLTVNGKNIGDVIFRNNLEAITNNKVIAQAIVEKYPNMIASEIAVNNVGKGVIETTLKSLKVLNLSEDQINRIVEIVQAQGAFGIDNKLKGQSQKAIQDIVGSKVVTNLVVRSIENTRLDLEKILSRSDALVLEPGTFRTSSDGKQVENKGYVLSSKARSEISELLGQEEAKGVIDSVESTLNTERIVNDVKMFKSDPSQLIKLCSANVNPTAICMLFNDVKNRVPIINKVTGQTVEMSLTDLAGLVDNAKEGVASQLKELIKHLGKPESEMFVDRKESTATLSKEEVVEMVGQYVKDSVNVEEFVKQAMEKVDKANEELAKANKKLADLNEQLEKLKSPTTEQEDKEVIERQKEATEQEKQAIEKKKEVVIEELNKELERLTSERIKPDLIDVNKSVRALIKDLEKLRDMPEEEIEKDVRLKGVFSQTNYNEASGLSSRLQLLTDKVEGEKTRAEMIEEKFFGERGLVKQAEKFIEENGIKNSQGKIEGLKEGSLDRLREQAIKRGGEEGIDYIRVTINECIRKVKGFGLRASQLELATTLQNDVNAALGMGAGKTVVLVMDAAVQRVLMGKALNQEILVGNGDLSNFAGANSDGVSIFKFLGMKPAVITDFKEEGGDTNVAKLKEAYEDPNTVIIMDPTIRGHMMNESVRRGGLEGRELRNILESVNRVTVDEVHLWALTRTAAVIGEDNKPPDAGIVEKAVQIGEIINAKEIYKEMIKGVKAKATIAIEGKEVQVVRYNKEADLLKGKMKGEYIAIIGEQTASIEIKMSDGIRDSMVKEIGRAPEGYSASGMLQSMIKGLFASSTENGGMAIGQDGKVKPVGATGIEESMVISDIYLQLGFALRKGLERGVVEIETYMTNSTQQSNTSMQTSLAAIYSGASARMVGISGTVKGLQQLIINKTGSGKIYNITGESADPSMFNRVMKVGVDLTEEDMRENLRSLKSGLKLREEEISKIVEIAAKKGSLDGNNKLTPEAQEEVQKIIGKDIKQENIEYSRLKENIKLISGSIGDGLTAKITNIVKGIKEGEVGIGVLENVLMLGKTQGSIESYRRAVKGAIENIGGFEEFAKLKIEIYEFTDKQGRWTNEKGDISADLGNGMRSITEVAKSKGIKRIIIANEMGATGVDYQGNFLNVISDAHLMSNTDLAQALKRTGRPNTSFAKEGGLQRWQTERVIKYEQARVQGELDAFKENAEFVEYAKDLWKGTKAGENMKDARSEKWLKVMEEGGFELTNPKVIEGLYKLSSGYKEGQKIDTTKEEVIDKAMKEAIIFISKVQDLRSVDASIRFAINDSIRDRMVLSVLREVVGALAEGEAKQAVQAELKEALKSNGIVTKDVFEVKGNKKAQTAEEVMRKAFDSSMQEAKDRIGRLQEVLRRFGKEVRVAKQIEVMGNHLESINIAMADDMYYGSKAIRDKGLGDAIDMSEFVQIVRSFEEYIMPMANVVDRTQTISIEGSIEDRASKAVREYLKNESSLSIVNDKEQRVLTEKGAMFVRMMQEELGEEGSAALARYEWLAGKIGASYTDLSEDVNLEEQTKKRIENVRNLVDKLEEINKELRYEVVKELYVLEKEEEVGRKEYSKEEIEEEINKKSQEYKKEEERKKRAKEEVGVLEEGKAVDKERKWELDRKISSLQEEYGDHRARFNEMGVDEAEYEIMGEIRELNIEMEGLKEKEEENERRIAQIQKQINKEEEKDKEEGKEGEVRAGARVEGIIISQVQSRVKADIEKDASLSKIDQKGERVLTHKGVIYAKVAKEIVGGNKDYVRFLMEGPLSKVGGIGEKIKANMGDKGEIKYQEELVKGITNALWEANIWEYSKVEKLKGFYGLIPESERRVLDNMSIGQLKGILNAQHKEAIKGVAEQRGYKLPEAQVVELARLARGMKLEGENERLGKYLRGIAKEYEELEGSVEKMKRINNSISEASMAVSISPKVVKKVWAGIRGVWQYIGVGGTRWKLKGVSESVDISIQEAIGIVGIGRQKVGSLVSYAGGVGSSTEEGLDKFDTIVKNTPGDQVGSIFEGHVNWKKVAVTGGLILGGIGIAVGVGVMMAFIGPLVGAVGVVGAVVMGVVSGMGVVGGIGAVGAKFNIISKIMPKGGYWEKLKITDMEKFSKLGVFTGLIRNGKIDLSKEEEMEKVRGKSLYKAVKAPKGYMQEISDEEGRLILGEGGWWTDKRSYDIIKENKRNIIEGRVKELVADAEFRGQNKQEKGESPRKYEERLNKLAKSEVELGFKWSMGFVKKVIESGGYEGDKQEQEKVLAVLIGEGNVNTQELVSRYKNVSQMADIIDERVGIKDLQNNRMFKEDNSISSEFINEYVREELIMREVEKKLEGVGYKEGKEGKAKGWEKLVGKMGEGFKKPQELNRAILQTLVIFDNIGSMEEYLGLEGKEYTKEEIVEGAFRTYKKALGLFAQGEIGQEGLRQEIEIIRTVSEMLMISKEKPELVEAINKDKIDELTLNKIESMVDIENTKVNKYVFIEELRKEVKEARGKEEVFEIKIEELKKGLERKEEKREKLLPKEEEELSALLERGQRGKYNTVLTMGIREVRAISQAA